MEKFCLIPNPIFKNLNFAPSKFLHNDPNSHSRMSIVLYYLLLKPVSYLPLSVLYYLSDFLYFLLYQVTGYRKKVVFTNLRNSFPDKSEAEITVIGKAFYRHLCDVIVEAIRVFSISEEEITRRCPVTNPELADAYFEQGRSVIIAGGHYNNWEIAGIICNPQMKHQLVGIFSPLADPFLNRKMIESRGRFGLEMLPTKKVKEFFANNTHRLTATIFGADQSPSNAKNAYWTTFLHQDTAVMFGTEKYAQEYNYPVLFVRVRKLSRGYYDMSFDLLEENPASSPYGAISEAHTRALEKQILEHPEFWLWTHKRWKRKREDVSVDSQTEP